jgi:integrase
LSIKHITRQYIIDFCVYLSSEQNLSKLTIKKYVQIVHSFFNFELDRGNIDTNPAVRIPSMGKIVDCAAVPFQADERTKMKECISKSDPQLWLACQIQYYCAIRPGTELRLMKIKWIDFQNCTFRIPNEQAKNNKTEIVHIPPFLMEELRAMEYHLHHDKEMYVFGKYGRVGYEPLGKNTLRNRFNRYREALGISTEHKFYSWKHTGAISLIHAGAKPYDMKNHLRHASFATTEVYLKKQSGNTDTNISTLATEI